MSYQQHSLEHEDPVDDAASETASVTQSMCSVALDETQSRPIMCVPADLSSSNRLTHQQEPNREGL